MTTSEEFRAVHRDAGRNKPLYLWHPEFEGFTAVEGRLKPLVRKVA